MLKLVLTTRAEQSLEDIIDYYLLRHSAKRAEKVLQTIESAFDEIKYSPQKFHVCLDVKSPTNSIRQMIVHQTFKIVYRIMSTQIEIIEIFHGSRNPDLILDIAD